jgi:YD repeat-containing protein
LENQTGWIRHFKKDDQKERFMHMMWKVQEGGQATETGRDNKLFGVLTSTDSTALVGGYNTLVIGDEVGVNKTLLDDINFIEPSIKQGGLLTGNLIIGGSVGELSDCEDLRKITYNPEEYGFLGVQDLENPTDIRLPLIPMQWNYWEGTEDSEGNIIGVTRHYDIDGNSNIESAKKAINRIRELKKKQDAGSFALFCSQNPISLNEMYQMRETNIFPTPKLNKQFLWLEMNHKDHTYELEYDAEDKVIAKEVPKAIVTDFPLKAESYREGAVVILEQPVSSRPFIYYAGIDPVQNLMNAGSSLMSCYIYQALYRDGNEMKGGKIVAWYTGRYTDDEETFETVRKLCKYYNAHCAIESDDGAFIEWMKGKKEHHMMFKRNQFPFLKDLIPNSSIGDEYGIRMNTGGTVSRTKQFIFSSMVEYINEVMGEITIDGYLDPEGNVVKQKIYGVERLKDQMLIKELLNYGKGNFDRVIAASIAIATGRAYEASQMIQKVNTAQSGEAPPKPYSIKAPNQFKRNQYSASSDYKSFWGKVNKMRK